MRISTTNPATLHLLLLTLPSSQGPGIAPYLKFPSAKTPAWTSKCPCKERCKFGRIWYVKYLPPITWSDVIVTCQSKEAQIHKANKCFQRFDGLRTRIGISINRG